MVAAFLAIATFLGNEAVKDAIQSQTKVSDARTGVETFDTQDEIFSFNQAIIGLFALSNDRQQAKLALSATKQLEGAQKKVGEERKKRAETVKEKQKEVSDANDKHLIYELAEVLLQIAIVLASVAIIARRRFLLYGGQALAAAGIVVLVVGVVM